MKSLAWKNLHSHYAGMRSTLLKDLFLKDANRCETFSLEAAGLLIDYSKNFITSETVNLLLALAEECHLKKSIHALFSGEKINVSEDQAAWHTALRFPHGQPSQDVQCELNKMAGFAEKLQQKKLFGYSGKPIESILHVGMGGSSVGPMLYHQALPQEKQFAQCYFLTEFDAHAIQKKLQHCNPETTIVIIVSKTFTTQETMTIFERVRLWFVEAAGSIEKIQQNFFAVTENIAEAKSKNIVENHILKIWNWVGGRFSIWSAVNFANVLVYGFPLFQRFLHGAYQMDQHFSQAPFEKNIPVILGLLSVWYNNFFDAQSQAMVPYSANLSALPSYLQQLNMESLGKSVNAQGEKINIKTGTIVWGDVGPNSQHSFHQLLMQGTHLIPVEFILSFENRALNEFDMKRAAYCLSQSQTLMVGHDGECSAQKIFGNQPSTTIFISHFSAETLGALLAMYEHIVFVKSVIWNINAFDQWGVERGKNVAKTLLQNIHEKKISADVDSSTRTLLEKIIRRME